MSQRTFTTPAKVYRGPDTFDTIVIGSGIGGLGLAALLAKQAHRRVLVLERHYTAGGMTHTFRRPNYEWDVGVHYVGDMHEGSPSRALVEYLTEGRLPWAPMPDAYDRVHIGDVAFDYVRGAGRLRAALIERFSRPPLDAYFAAVERVTRRATLFFAEKTLPGAVARLVGGVMRGPFMSHARRTTRAVLDGLTRDELLQAILTAQWGDYGLPPGQSSFAAHAIITRHYFEGGSYPVGGAGRIAEAVWPVVARDGGVLLVDAEAARIDVRDRRVTGVTLTTGQSFRAPLVVSDAGLANTVEQLVPAEHRAAVEPLAALTRELPRSTAHVCLYVGLTQPAATPAGNLWIYPGPDHDTNVARSAADPEAPLPLVYVSWPSAKDPTFAERHGGRGTIDIITMVPFAWFDRWRETKWRHRGEEYDALKARLTDRLLDTLYRHVPEVRGLVDVAELSTPLTTRHFANYRQGEIYGLAHTPARFAARALRPETGIRGLYLTGQDIALCGVMGALSGAYTCASAMLGRNVFGAATRA
jgi:all-trans-retinol 13,14-reductase